MPDQVLVAGLRTIARARSARNARSDQVLTAGLRTIARQAAAVSAPTRRTAPTQRRR